MVTTWVKPEVVPQAVSKFVALRLPATTLAPRPTSCTLILASVLHPERIVTICLRREAQLNMILPLSALQPILITSVELERLQSGA
jgi:hypothetical protein